MKRRQFVGGLLMGGAWSGQGLRGLREEPSPPVPAVKGYRTLGRTGFKTSDIGFGAGPLNDEGVLKAALDRGVNYIDTAEAYVGGRSETVIGNVLKGRDRKSLFITTKLGLKPSDRRLDIENRVRRCLARLQTDYVDCVMIHMAGSRQEVANEEFHEGVKALKADGRIRHLGVSCHGAGWQGDPKESMEDIIGAAIEDGRYDVVLFVYNFVQREMAERLLGSCHRRGVGATLMKTDLFGGGFLTELRGMADKLTQEGKPVPPAFQAVFEQQKALQQRAAPYLEQQGASTPAAIRDASIRFVLSHPDVHSVLVTFRTFDQLDGYLRLSATRLTGPDRGVLRAFADTDARLYCRHACGRCEPACPDRVPVNTIMRYHRYFAAQQRERYAMEQYRALPASNAASCDACAGPCEQACPYGVPVRSLLMCAHEQLAWKQHA